MGPGDARPRYAPNGVRVKSHSGSEKELQRGAGLWCKLLACLFSRCWVKGSAMTGVLGLAELFDGRHFDRKVIVLCVRWYLPSNSASGTWWR